MDEVIDILESDLGMAADAAADLAQEIVTAGAADVGVIFDMLIDAVAGASFSELMSAAIAIFAVLL